MEPQPSPAPILGSGRPRRRRGRGRSGRGPQDAAAPLQNGSPAQPAAAIPEATEVTGYLVKEPKIGSILQAPAGALVAFIPPGVELRFGLRVGDLVTGTARPAAPPQRYPGLLQVTSVNGVPAEQLGRRPAFEDTGRLTPIYPDRRIVCETAQDELTGRMIDLFAPVGMGQRLLIVSPPKAGKTTILKTLARALATNHPELPVILSLIGERPEEVTDFRRSTTAEIFATDFSDPPQFQIAVAELALERCKRLAEMGKDAVLLMDSVTRLARAYNLVSDPRESGRTLSGGADASALTKARTFLGAARNFEEGGSLTLIATALIQTGSVMDTVIYEDLKATGNSEIVLSRELQERRVFPALQLVGGSARGDAGASGTRNEERLYPAEALSTIHAVRRTVSQLGSVAATEKMIEYLRTQKTNAAFLEKVRASIERPKARATS